jgi:hypothetical protein
VTPPASSRAMASRAVYTRVHPRGASRTSSSQTRIVPFSPALLRHRRRASSKVRIRPNSLRNGSSHCSSTGVRSKRRRSNSSANCAQFSQRVRRQLRSPVEISDPGMEISSRG